mmetsp:Transcript_12139/g.33660  ORF Transcript_12139/g.33660 Transcript_12139/m.33660 type:complete len:321 (-) Transcript_12139:1687-2649(-)
MCQVALEGGSLLLLAGLEGIALQELWGEDSWSHLSQEFLHVVGVTARGSDGDAVAEPDGLLHGPQPLRSLPCRVMQLQGVIEIKDDYVGGVRPARQDLIGVTKQLRGLQPLAVGARARSVGAPPASAHAVLSGNEPILLALSPSGLILAGEAQARVRVDGHAIGSPADRNGSVLLRPPSVRDDVANEGLLGLPGSNGLDLIRNAVQDPLDLLDLLPHHVHAALAHTLRGVLLRELLANLPDVVEEGGGLVGGPDLKGGVQPPREEVGLGAVHDKNFLATIVPVLLRHLPQPLPVVAVRDCLGTPTVTVRQHGPRGDLLHA